MQVTCTGIDENLAEDGITVISQFVHLRAEGVSIDIVQLDIDTFEQYTVDKIYSVQLVEVI